MRFGHDGRVWLVGCIQKPEFKERATLIFTRRFGALAARPQFLDAPELQQELDNPVDLDAELARLTGQDDEQAVDESAA